MSYVPSGRRMVSLGKVHAPKPVNLPSQKRENNGLDPNVALVPRGSSNSSCWGAGSNQSGSSDLSGVVSEPPSAPSDPAGNPTGQQHQQPNGSTPRSTSAPLGPRPGEVPLGPSAAWGGAGLPEQRQNHHGKRFVGDFPQLGQEGDADGDGARHYGPPDGVP
eukprot:scaffold154719_cov41-Prasinocladus_malaysianus.AAC.1